MKRLIAIVLAAMLLCSGCTGESAYIPTGDGLTDVEATKPTETTPVQPQQLSLTYYPNKGLNPYTCTEDSNRMLFLLLYQSLFTVNSQYEVEPQLCRSYTVSRDMMHYLFFLEEATFSDGTVLSVADVYSSLETARTSPVYRGRFSCVESIVPTQDGVQVNLKMPYENFPLLLDVPIVKASQVQSGSPEGTGPYVLETGVTGPWLRLRRDWWCKANLPLSAEKIPLRTAASTIEMRDQFERENVGVVCANPGANSYVDFRCSYELWDCENGGFLYLGCYSGSNVFRNNAVRQALSFAIDRQSIAMKYYLSFAQPTTIAASPSFPYYDKAEAARVSYNPDYFKQVLAENELDGATIVLLVNKDDGKRLQVARCIADELRACGLKVTLRSLGGDDYVTALRNGRYDLYLGQTRLSPNMDLSAFFSPDGALNYGGMANSSIYSLCQDALANHGNYSALFQAVLADGKLCPVAFLSSAIYAQRGLMEDFTPARDSIFYYSLGKTMESAKIS